MTFSCSPILLRLVISWFRMTTPVPREFQPVVGFRCEAYRRTARTTGSPKVYLFLWPCHRCKFRVEQHMDGLPEPPALQSCIRFIAAHDGLHSGLGIVASSALSNTRTDGPCRRGITKVVSRHTMICSLVFVSLQVPF